LRELNTFNQNRESVKNEDLPFVL